MWAAGMSEKQLVVAKTKHQQRIQMRYESSTTAKHQHFFT
jgi:hypothetical protein